MNGIFSAAPGVSLPSMTLQGGARVRGIEIDNPSGNWLYVQELQDFCPPYTLNWARDFAIAALNVSVLANQSPAGQVNTNQGDRYTVYLDSNTVGAKAGIPASFISQFNPLQTLQIARAFTPGQAIANQVATTAVTGGTKRIRIHQIRLSRHDDGIANQPTLFAPIIGVLTTNLSYYLRIGGTKLMDSLSFVPYIDLPSGVELSLTLRNPTTAFLDMATFGGGVASESVSMVAAYEVI